MLKEIRPRREIASGKGGARTPKPRDYEAVFVLSPASECQSCLERRDRRAEINEKELHAVAFVRVTTIFSLLIRAARGSPPAGDRAKFIRR